MSYELVPDPIDPSKAGIVRDEKGVRLAPVLFQVRPDGERIPLGHVIDGLASFARVEIEEVENEGPEFPDGITYTLSFQLDEVSREVLDLLSGGSGESP